MSTPPPFSSLPSAIPTTPRKRPPPKLADRYNTPSQLPTTPGANAHASSSKIGLPLSPEQTPGRKRAISESSDDDDEQGRGREVVFMKQEGGSQRKRVDRRRRSDTSFDPFVDDTERAVPYSIPSQHPRPPSIHTVEDSDDEPLISIKEESHPLPPLGVVAPPAEPAVQRAGSARERKEAWARWLAAQGEWVRDRGFKHPKGTVIIKKSEATSYYRLKDSDLATLRYDTVPTSFPGKFSFAQDAKRYAHAEVERVACLKAAVMKGLGGNGLVGLGDEREEALMREGRRVFEEENLALLERKGKDRSEGPRTQTVRKG